jgi:lipopolysaccharide transport system permease protein
MSRSVGERLAWYSDLIRFKVYSSLVAESARTYLGFLWWILEPIFLVAVYYVVFGIYLSFDRAEFIPMLIVGVTAWQWLNRSVMNSTQSILNKANVLTKLNINRLVMPLTDLISDAVKMIMILAAVVAILNVMGYSINLRYGYLPLVFATQGLLIAGLSLWGALLVPFAQDLRYVISLALRALMLGSGIFYSLDRIPEDLQQAFLMNPVASIIESYRRILIYGDPPMISHLSYSALAGLVLIGGAVLFERSLRQRYTILLAT